MSQRAEKSHKAEGLTVSFGVHAMILLGFGFWAFGLPDPPLSDPSWGGGGVVLNIGDMYVGTGDPTNLHPTTLDASENLESTPVEDQLAENSSQPLSEEEITPTNDPEAVPIEKEKTKEKAKTDNKEDKADNKNNTNNNNTTNNSKTDQQKVDSKALFTGTTKKAGDDKDKAGDPGNPEGVDPNALFKDGTAGKGKGGAGDGSGISIGGGIAGWAYSGNPLPNDNSQEKGTLIYKIYVSDDGIVTKVELKENRGISPKIEKLYYNQLYKLVFDPVGKVAPITEGEVSYKINVK